MNRARVSAVIGAVVSVLVIPALSFAQISCPNLYRNLSLGSRGQDVVELQAFLIAEGDLAPGNNTGYFGRLTKEAVINFQFSKKLPQTGLVGPMTRAKIANVCGDGTVANNFIAYPTSDAAPLSVYFSAGLAVSQEASHYLVDFGDGTSAAMTRRQIQECAGGGFGCAGGAPPTTISTEHVYASSGTYTAQLYKSDPYTCSAPNPDTGMSHCTNMTQHVIGTATIIVSSGVPQSKNISFTSDLTSGYAPLNISFKSNLLEGEKPDYVIDYGDGIQRSVGPGAICEAMIGGACYITQHTYGSPGKYTVRLLRQSSQQTVGSIEIEVKVYPFSGTINAGTYDESQPTITGTATGVDTVGIVIDKGTFVYSSDIIIPVVNGKWSHTVTKPLLPATYNIGLIGSGAYRDLAHGTIVIR